MAGFEALIRWNRPGHGLVGPGCFIPAAEASTLICDIGRWALKEATRQLARWSAQGLGAAADIDLRIAVNVSGRHVASTALVDDVACALDASGVAPDRLVLELTETVLTDGTLAGAQLAAVRALGVSVAIDDFGTGYTSIGQLPSLPADMLKIDRSFVGGTDAPRQELVSLIIGAAHACDLRVVGEGVEDVETLQALRELGCDTAQGFLMARPMPADRVATWLADWRANTRDGLLGDEARLLQALR